jgi:bifunctional DNA-binding transcriptional regulator/antitoxin component of YhaV-PrlF toxin-antitoxin module
METMKRTEMLLGETTYYCKNYHKDRNGKYLNTIRGTTRILYIPLGVQLGLNLRHGDVVRFVVNADGEVVLRKA